MTNVTCRDRGVELCSKWRGAFYGALQTSDMFRSYSRLSTEFVQYCLSLWGQRRYGEFLTGR